MLRKLILTSGMASAVGCAVVSPPRSNPVPAPMPAPVIPVAGQVPAGPLNQPESTSLPDRLPAPASPSATATLSAEPAGCLSLAAIEELAFAHNPTLVQAQAQVDGTLGKALQAGLWPNPVLGYAAEQIGSEGTAGEFQGGFVQQEIVTARKRRVSREKYLARARAAEFVALAQQYRVVNDIRRVYWRAAGAARLVAVSEEVVKNAEDRLVTTDEMFNVGQATAVDVRQARVGFQRAKLDLRMMVNDRDQHRRELAALVGTDLPAGPLADPLDDLVPPVTWEASLAYTMSESPEVLETQAKLRADRITVDRERRQPIPNVFVQAGPGYDFTEDQTVVNAQVSVQLPIWDGTRGRSARPRPT